MYFYARSFRLACECSLLNSMNINTVTIHSPSPLVFVVVDLISVSTRTRLLLLDSLKWNNRFWPALLVTETATMQREH